MVPRASSTSIDGASGAFATDKIQQTVSRGQRLRWVAVTASWTSDGHIKTSIGRLGVASASMSFLRRLLGGDEPVEAPAFDAGEVDAEERQHELEVLRAEQERLDELAQRQLRYADYAWQPPPQGGERRADDGDEREP
jgi:hypothetical protein